MVANPLDVETMSDEDKKGTVPDLPVQDWAITPGPKYSKMRPVPPRTVSFPAR